jgi:hypothetical protein
MRHVWMYIKLTQKAIANHCNMHYKVSYKPVSLLIILTAQSGKTV